MITRQRVFHDDNGTLKDLSKVINRYNSETAALPIVAADDYLYIGSDLPFNSRYFEMGTANTAAATISQVDIWDGTAWNAAVDVLDYTETGGATVGRSGYVRWTLDRNESWACESTTEDITELSSLKIYDFYWARVKFSADLDAGTTLKYVGQKFSTDDDFQGRYQDLTRSSIKTAYQSGKTDWNEQHIAASEDLFMELRRKKHLWHPNQALDHEAFATACTHKAAAIIFNAFGDDYENERKRAEGDFQKALAMSFSPIDRNEDGAIDDEERRPIIRMFRS